MERTPYSPICKEDQTWNAQERVRSALNFTRRSTFISVFRRTMGGVVQLAPRPLSIASSRFSSARSLSPPSPHTHTHAVSPTFVSKFSLAEFAPRRRQARARGHVESARRLQVEDPRAFFSRFPDRRLDLFFIPVFALVFFSPSFVLFLTTSRFRFWLEMALKYVRSSSLPLRLFGWEQITDIIEAARLERPPATRHIKGAAPVNGPRMFLFESVFLEWSILFQTFHLRVFKKKKCVPSQVPRE